MQYRSVIKKITGKKKLVSSWVIEWRITRMILPYDSIEYNPSNLSK